MRYIIGLSSGDEVAKRVTNRLGCDVGNDT